jgi:hypothetical protein
MMFLLVVMPFMIIFSDHDLFFIIFSIILFISSSASVYTFILEKTGKYREAGPDLNESIEESVGKEVKGFTSALSTAGNLAVILYLIYCNAYMNYFAMRVLTSALVAYRLWNITGNFRIFRDTADSANQDIAGMEYPIIHTTAGLLTILFITAVVIIRLHVHI